MIPAPLLVVTDRHGSGRPLVDTVRAVLAAGARWIWFRDRDLEPQARRQLAEELLLIVRAAGGCLLIGGDADLAAAIGANGVQLSSAEAAVGETGTDGPSLLARRIAVARKRLCPQAIVGVSAHGTAEIREAVAAGADYATLSPIFATASKPGYGPALGLEGLREAASLGLSLVALGGIEAGSTRSCLEAGAAGVAVMGALMRAEDPEAETRRLLEALRITS